MAKHSVSGESSEAQCPPLTSSAAIVGLISSQVPPPPAARQHCWGLVTLLYPHRSSHTNTDQISTLDTRYLDTGHPDTESYSHSPYPRYLNGRQECRSPEQFLSVPCSGLLGLCWTQAGFLSPIRKQIVQCRWFCWF